MLSVDHAKDGDSNLKSNIAFIENGSGDTSTETFYGVYIQPEGSSPDTSDPEIHVYKDKNEVLKLLKTNKKARFKAFTNEKDAALFSSHGCESQKTVDMPKTLISSPTSQLNISLGEKSAFKAPKSQDLVKFRKSIENKDMNYFLHCIKENPRYLVSSGDTPSILQEGSRYNALHISAKANNAAACSYIINTIKSTSFIEKLYSTSVGAEDRCSILLDLYLNTPDKGQNETPLHFAAKLGSLEVAQVLLSEKSCDKNRLNRYGETARDIICKRASGQALQNKEAIERAMSDSYYVPVLRSPDNTIPPVLGDPFSPTSPVRTSGLENKHVKSPMEIRALAGPMSQEDAFLFRKKWKTPPRDPRDSPVRSDPEKGMEKVGRTLASSHQVPWREYWEFLDTFVDLSSPEGLDMLENYLAQHIFTQKEKPPKLRNSSTRLQLDRLLSELSPVSSLCLEFSGMNITSPSLPEIPKVGFTNEVNFNAKNCVTNSYMVFATRFTSTLSRFRKAGLLTEVNYLQNFITGCYQDDRFINVDFSCAHFEVAVKVVNMMKIDRNLALIFLKELIVTYSCNKFVKCATPQSVDAMICICQFICQLLDSGSRMSPKSCNCSFLKDSIPKKDWPRKLFDYDNNKTRQPSSCAQKNVSGDSDEEYPSEEEFDFVTPSSTPPQLFSSDEEGFEDCETWDGSLFLSGTQPSKLDAAVLDSISGISINNKKYPCIYSWKQLCSRYAYTNPKEMWPTPMKRPQCLFKKRTLNPIEDPLPSTDSD